MSVSMLGRVVIDASGNRSGEIMMSLVGNISKLQKQESFTVNSNSCAVSRKEARNAQ